MAHSRSLAWLAPLALCSFIGPAHAQPADMTFFVSSVRSGKGADLGGLEGANALCARLAQAAGSSGKTWRAYLSTQGANAVNARDRIGRGPWRNAKGVVVAQDVADLHGAGNNVTKQTALRAGRAGERPRRHAQHARHPDRLAAGRHGVHGRRRSYLRQLHEERYGRRRDGRPPRPHRIERRSAGESWNSSHSSRGGCSQDALKSTGGAGLIYCFAAN